MEPVDQNPAGTSPQDRLAKIQNIDPKASIQGTHKPNYQEVTFNQPVDHRGVALYVKGFINQSSNQSPNQRPIIFIHELGESMKAYEPLINNIAQQGRTVFIYDQRGHGRSGGIMGHVESFEEFVDDLIQISSWVRHKCNSQCPIIVAHGLGALIALRFMRKMPRLCAGAVFLTPGMTLNINWLKKAIAVTFAEIWPQLRLPRKLTPRSILGSQSQLPQVTAKLVAEVIQAAKEIKIVAPFVSTPILSIGTEARDRFDYAQAKDVLLVGDGARDEYTIQCVHRDVFGKAAQTEKLVEMTLDWIRSIETQK